MSAASPSTSGTTTPHAQHCRFCDRPLERTFVDLGMSPLCESFVPPDRVEAMEPFFPLHVRVCDGCGLVQLPAFVSPEEIFTEYAYFSAYSTSWVEHARRYVEAMIDRLGLGADSFAVELASNDGYLLQHFLGTDVRILGVEPAANVAKAAEERGVPTLVAFFGRDLAAQIVKEHGQADLIAGNNVLAQVPDLNDFVGGVAILLAENGTTTFEFPHLLRLVEGLQYDTIYHEHFSYFSLETTETIMRAHGLEVYDVDELSTHGGSIRVYIGRAGAHPIAPAVTALREKERRVLVGDDSAFARFAEDVAESKRALLELLTGLRRQGAQVVGYGAPGKGNTLLNYCGIRTDFLEYTVDRNPYKHGRFLPGTHIPIYDTDRIAETRPDYILVLPWNLIDEISKQLSYVADWGAKLIVPVPRAEIVAPATAAAA
jgi:hypothetical protein